MVGVLFVKILASFFLNADAVGVNTTPPPKVAFLFAQTGGTPLIEREMEKGLKVFEYLFPQSTSNLQIQAFDNKGTVEGTLSALKEISEKGYQFVVGIRKGEEALAASQFAEQNGLLFITPLASFSLTTQGKKNTFQISANEVLIGAALARFVVQDLDRKKILILVNNRSLFSQSFANSFEKGIKTYPDVRLQKHFSNGLGLNLDKLKAQLKSFNPDLVFLSDDISNSAVLAKYIHKKDPYLPFLTGESFGNESAIKTLLKEVPKMRLYFSSAWTDRERNSQNNLYKKGYREIFPGKRPTEEAALTFDALFILSKAINSASPDLNLDRVRFFLERNQFETTQGLLDFRTGPTHSPVKSVHIKVTNISKTKFVKTLRAKWKLEP